MDKRHELQLLGSNLRQTSRVVLVVLSLSWLFVIGSLYISVKSGTDWFSRSGSVMGLVGAACTFKLAGALQRGLVIVLRHQLATLKQEFEFLLDPSAIYQLATYCSYLTGIVGTVIWGYGDKLLRLFSAS